MLGSALTEFLSAPGTVAVGTFVLGFFVRVFSERLSANRLFDHRLKLEKEYSLYAELWEKLFELRRDLGAMLDDEESRDIVAERHDAFQAVVRRNEPMMSTAVYEPAREIAQLARAILSNVDKISSIDAGHPSSAVGRNPEDDRQHADTKIRLDAENDTSFEEIEQLYQAVLAAIRRRVRVP